MIEHLADDVVVLIEPSSLTMMVTVEMLLMQFVRDLHDLVEILKQVDGDHRVLAVHDDCADNLRVRLSKARTPRAGGRWMRFGARACVGEAQP